MLASLKIILMTLWEGGKVTRFSDHRRGNSNSASSWKAGSLVGWWGCQWRIGKGWRELCFIDNVVSFCIGSDKL